MRLKAGSGLLCSTGHGSSGTPIGIIRTRCQPHPHSANQPDLTDGHRRRGVRGPEMSAEGQAVRGHGRSTERAEP